MIFTTGTISVCTGGNHLQLPITIGGNTKTLHITREELRGEPPDGFEDIRELIIQRLRSAVKETTVGPPTPAEVQAAVNNKTFEI